MRDMDSTCIFFIGSQLAAVPNFKAQFGISKGFKTIYFGPAQVKYIFAAHAWPLPQFIQRRDWFHCQQRFDSIWVKLARTGQPDCNRRDEAGISVEPPKQECVAVQTGLERSLQALPALEMSWKELEGVTECFRTDLQRGIGDRQPCISVCLGLQLSECSNCLSKRSSFIQGDLPGGFLSPMQIQEPGDISDWSLCLWCLAFFRSIRCFM